MSDHNYTARTLFISQTPLGPRCFYLDIEKGRQILKDRLLYDSNFDNIAAKRPEHFVLLMDANGNGKLINMNLLKRDNCRESSPTRWLLSWDGISTSTYIDMSREEFNRQLKEAGYPLRPSPKAASSQANAHHRMAAK